ncbi:condensation domain-containing protein [Streptomyces sp. NPDC060053]|uniref:condensation domain-containing protein n=1 Tax=Streptomyces sp. NPDC060053 TaxID=3347047 RepID=UPI0036A4F9B5
MKLVVSGATAAAGPLATGQRYIWRAVERLAPQDQHMNLRAVLPVPPGVEVHTVLGVLTSAVSRCEALRTTYEYAESGEPRQVVHGDGVLPVTVATAGPGEARQIAEKLSRELAGTSFDRFGAWPLRLGLVQGDAEGLYVVLVLAHLATDGGGVAALSEVLRTSWQRPAHADAVLSLIRQPLAQAEFERSAEGIALHDRALKHWRQTLTKFPAVPSRPRLTPHEPRFLRGEFTSPCLARAATLLAARSGVSAQFVLLAATALALTARSGGDRCGITVISSNRHRPELKNAVLHLAQRVPVVLSLRHGSFDDLAKHACAVTLNASRYGLYPPERIRDLVREIRESRTDEIDSETTFNGMSRTMGHQPASEQDPGGERSWAELREAGSFSWTNRNDNEPDGLRFVDFFAPDRLRMYADTRLVSAQQIEAFGTEVESILVDAVEGRHPRP